MSLMSSHAPSASSQAGGFLTRIAALAGGLFASFADWQRVRRNTLELGSLSDESLKDIGIERSQIERIARHGRSFR
ncbi:DUF1127 domain-containing protein [Phreatobacter sp.]|uniref:DUF1127 domain-containing protein n=1 Tax=Phreatobacter sp. TaxID=1966341 RepID=UPI003F70067A